MDDEATAQSQEYGIRSSGEEGLGVGLQMNQKGFPKGPGTWSVYIYLLVRKCRSAGSKGIGIGNGDAC